MPPAATVNVLVKAFWALNCSTPLPVLVMPPEDPTMAWIVSSARRGSMSATPLVTRPETLMVLGEEPKSKRPSRLEIVVVLEAVAVRPWPPIVRIPVLPPKLRLRPEPVAVAG